MTDFILDYLADRGCHAASRDEQARLEAGISQYLLENGIRTEETRPYYRKYAAAHLGKIAAPDLKLYFLHYPAISEVRQIVLEFCAGKELTEERKEKLSRLMEELYRCGLGGKYTPAAEVKEILGRFS